MGDAEVSVVICWRIIHALLKHLSLPLLLLDRVRMNKRGAQTASCGSYISYPSYNLPKFHVNPITLSSAGA